MSDDMLKSDVFNRHELKPGGSISHATFNVVIGLVLVCRNPGGGPHNLTVSA